MYRDRIRLPSLLDKVMSAADAAALIEDGMTVGMSGFTRAGEAKAVPQALAERAKVTPLKISLMTGASLGNDLDKQLTEAGVLSRRMPFQVDSTLRKAINAGEVMFIDQHSVGNRGAIAQPAIEAAGHRRDRSRGDHRARAISCRPPRSATRPASRFSPST